MLFLFVCLFVYHRWINFNQPWKLSDVILVVEEEKFHVHRAVLALSSPVFEKMFWSEFQEKDKKEVTLPDKKADEVEGLLLMLYPSVAEKQITEEIRTVSFWWTLPTNIK